MTRHRLKTTERGVALVGAICFTVVVLGLGMAVTSMATYEHVSSKRAADTIVSRNIAEAGTDMALWQLQQNPTWRCAGSPAAFTNAPLTTTVAGQSVTLGRFTVKPITTNTDGTVSVSADGLGNGLTNGTTGKSKTIAVSAYPQMARMFPAAVVGKISVALGGGTDAYDSNAGSYSGPGNGLLASVMTTATTTSSLSYGTIYGSAVYGYGTPSGQLVHNGTIMSWNGSSWATATGNAGVTSSPAPVSVPDVVVPAGLTNLGDISGGQVIPAGTWACTSISVKGNSSVTTTGPVVLYCTGTVEFKGKGSMYPASGKPADLQLYCAPSCTSVTLCGNGNTTACVYAPNADVRMNGGGNSGALYGAVVGNTINFNGNHTWVHYDIRLNDITGSAPVGYKTKTWQENG